MRGVCVYLMATPDMEVVLLSSRDRQTPTPDGIATHRLTTSVELSPRVFISRVGHAGPTLMSAKRYSADKATPITKEDANDTNNPMLRLRAPVRIIARLFVPAPNANTHMGPSRGDTNIDA